MLSGDAAVAAERATAARSRPEAVVRASHRLLQASDVPLMLALMGVGLGLRYLFGKHLYGVAGGVIAAAMLIVTPLDFAWATMITSDILVSFVSALAILLVLRALEPTDRDTKRRCWVGAGVCLWLGYH